MYVGTASLATPTKTTIPPGLTKDIALLTAAELPTHSITTSKPPFVFSISLGTISSLVALNHSSATPRLTDFSPRASLVSVSATYCAPSFLANIADAKPIIPPPIIRTSSPTAILPKCAA